MFRYIICRLLLLTVAVTPTLLFFTCIERKNPWDPVNGCPQTLLQEIKASSKENLIKISNHVSSIYQTVNQYTDSLTKARAVNDSLHNILSKFKYVTDTVKAFNENVENSNRISDCKDFKKKSIIDLFPDNLTFLTVSSDIDILRDSLSRDSLKIRAIIASDNSECYPQGIYSSQSIDSIMKPLEMIIARTDQMMLEIKAYNDAINDSNRILVKSLNIENQIINDNATIYNDSIGKIIQYCGRNWLSTRESIFAVTVNIKPGDTLLLDSGTIKADIHLYYRGRETQPIVIEGSPFANTRLDAANFTLTKCNNFMIKNINFVNGGDCNAKIDSGNAITFDKCTFSNSERGLDIIGSDVTFENCIISHNRKCGLKCANSSNVTLRNVLIFSNAGNGIENETSQMTITSSTISDNSGAGIYLINQKSTLTVISTLLTFNMSYGLTRERSEDTKVVELYNCAFFGNTPSDLNADSNRVNFSQSEFGIDPLFVNRESGDYTIGTNSELYNKGWGYRP